MNELGFEEQEEGGKKYLVLNDGKFSDHLLERALQLLEGGLGKLEEGKEKPKEPAKRVKCVGGCGFGGDAETENYCSLCHRKKYFGGGTAALPAAQNAPKKCIKECGFFGYLMTAPLRPLPAIPPPFFQPPARATSTSTPSSPQLTLPVLKNSTACAACAGARRAKTRPRLGGRS